MTTPSSWPTMEASENAASSATSGAPSNNTTNRSRHSSGSGNSFLKYMRPMTPPVRGYYMGPHSHYGLPTAPHSHPQPPHYPVRYPGYMSMMPVYFPRGPHRGVPPHAMAPHPHQHIGYIPSHLVPPFSPCCYPYQHNRTPGLPPSCASSWNQHKYSRPPTIPPRFAPSKSPRSTEKAVNTKSTRTRSVPSYRGRDNRAGRCRSRSPISRTFSPDCDLHDSSDEYDQSDDNQSKRRSKYRTLLHELAVNNEPAPVFNNNMKPQTLRQAICMYIDYLMHLNENRVSVAKFNNEPIMEPGFEFEDYYHEALNEDIHFPSIMFKDWLACYGVSIEVTDDPDGTDPGEKIVVITNLTTPRATPRDNFPAVVNSDASLSQTTRDCTPLSTSTGDGFSQYDTHQTAPVTDSESMYVPIPSPNAAQDTRHIADDCMITLVEDGDQGNEVGQQQTYTPNEAHKHQSKKRKSGSKRGRLQYNSTVLNGNAMDTYLPPRKSCLLRKEKKQKSSSKGEVGDSIYQSESAENQQLFATNSLTSGGEESSHTQYLQTIPSFTNMDQVQGQGDSSVLTHAAQTQHTANKVDESVVAADQLTQMMAGDPISLASPASMGGSLSQFITNACNVEENANQSSIYDMINLPPGHLAEQSYVTPNVEPQRGLHTPIFDDVGNTPVRQHTVPLQCQNSGHIQLNDPVLVEGAYGGLPPVDCSKSLNANDDLDGIDILSPESEWKRSLSSSRMSNDTDTASNNFENHIINVNSNAVAKHSEAGMEFECPFTGENLTRQVQDAMANNSSAPFSILE